MAALQTLALPDGRRGRLLAIGLTLAAIALVWLAAVEPLMGAFDAGSERIRERQALAERMTDLAATLPALQRQATELANAGPPIGATLQGDTDAIAAASLQSLLEGMAGSAGVHLTSSEALPADAVGAYRRVSLRVSVDADWAKLVALMQSLGRANPKMFIDDLQLHAQPTADKVRELPLDISFTVLAFRPASTAANKVANTTVNGALPPTPAATDTDASP